MAARDGDCSSAYTCAPFHGNVSAAQRQGEHAVELGRIALHPGGERSVPTIHPGRVAGCGAFGKGRGVCSDLRKSEAAVRAWGF